MTAGRELDALVAERVMGWKVFRNGEHGSHRWEAETDRGTLRVIDSSYSGDGFSPSTDIAAAWEVVEKMRDDHWLLDLRSGFIETRACFTRAHAGEYVAQEKSTPLAICLAALAAARAT